MPRKKKEKPQFTLEELHEQKKQYLDDEIAAQQETIERLKAEIQERQDELDEQWQEIRERRSEKFRLPMVLRCKDGVAGTIMEYFELFGAEVSIEPGTADSIRQVNIDLKSPHMGKFQVWVMETSN